MLPFVLVHSQCHTPRPGLGPALVTEFDFVPKLLGHLHPDLFPTPVLDWLDVYDPYWSGRRWGGKEDGAGTQMWKLSAGSCPVGEQRSCPRAQPPASAAPVFHRREIRFREVSDLVHTLCTWNPLIPVTFLIAVTRDPCQEGARVAYVDRLRGCSPSPWRRPSDRSS